MPGTNFLPKAGPSAIIGLLLGGCVMAIISLSYGYCIKKYPLSGGEFVYADASFGKKHAFACGWMIVLGYWSLIPLNSTAIGMITRYIFPGVFQFGHMYTIAGWDVYLGEVLLSSAFIIVLGYMNVKGVKSAGWFQTTVAVLLVGSVLFCVIGVLLAKPDFSNMQPFFAEISNGEVVSKGGLACIIAVACYAPYCFVGFDCIPQAAEEYSFSHKAAKALMVGAILVGALIYASMVFVTAVVEPWGPMMLGNPDWATGQAVQNTIGYVGLLFLGLAMLCAVLSGMNAFYLAASRLLYSMSYADALPSTFGELHPKYGTPDKATYFLLAISLVCPWFGRQVLTWVVDMTCVGAAVGFTYTCATATIMSKKDGLKGQTIISAIGTVLAAFFIILSFIPGSPGFLSVPSFIILGVWIVLGIIFWVKIKDRFLHGRWEGVDVEHILMSKMTEAGTIDSYNKNQ
ncbi:APC family permease [Pusillibacter faecalis]|nr:APC family permease [Pusillibacter faecalis]